MPLTKTSSNKALQANIGREIAAGKDPKQAAAIAYSTQQKARRAGDCSPEAKASLASAIKAALSTL